MLFGQYLAISSPITILLINRLLNGFFKKSLHISTRRWAFSSFNSWGISRNRRTTFPCKCKCRHMVDFESSNYPDKFRVLRDGLFSTASSRAAEFTMEPYLHNSLGSPSENFLNQFWAVRIVSLCRLEDCQILYEAVFIQGFMSFLLLPLCSNFL